MLKKSSGIGVSHRFEDYTINIGEDTIDINFTAEITSIGNSGIGSYEYWGSKGYDKGHDYIDEYDIEDLELSDGDPITNDLKERIMSVLESNTNDTIIREQLIETLCELDDSEPDDYERGIG